MLDILILGSPEVFWDGKPVSIPRRIPRTMLYYLATFSQPVARAKMLANFWPELDEHSARDAFRDNLAKLRAALPDPSLIHADNFSVCLDYNQVRVDYLDFQKLVTQIGRQPWQIPNDLPLPDSIVQPMELAASLWRANHLLQGIHLPDSQTLDEWLSITEQSIYHKRDRIIDRLIRHFFAIGDYENSIHWTEIALEADQVNEELHLLKLETLARSGHRSEALKYGQFVQDLFFKEYKEQPSNLFLSEFQKIKIEQEQTNQTRNQAIQSIQSARIPFVGRSDQLKTMEFAFQHCMAVLIEGDIGLGKTRLVQEYFSNKNPTPRLLVATCHPATTGIPFQPLIDMLRTGIHPEELALLDKTDLDCLARLDPTFQIKSKQSSMDEHIIFTDNHPWIHEAIFHLCRMVSKKQKVLFLLDDAHSADDATITTFRIMAKNKFLFSDAFLVITREKSYSNPALDRFVDELVQQKKLKRIQLDHLSGNDVKKLVASITGSPDDQILLDQIEQNLGGNPLMITETLRNTTLLASDPDGIASLNQIPGSIRAVLRERHRNLSPAMQTITSLIALSDPFAQIGVLEVASQLNGDDIVNALDELEKQDILISSDEVTHRGLVYRFRQNIFRDAVLLEMSATRKRLLHRRLATAMEAVSSPDAGRHAAILAEHFEACGDLEKGFHYWLKNADHSRKLSASGDANYAYQRAERLLTTIEIQLPDEEIASFFGDWADIAYLSHDPLTLTRIHTKLMDLGERRSSALLLGLGLSVQANNLFSTNHYAEGLVTIDQALRYYRDCGNLAEWLACMDRKSKFLYMLSRFNEACLVIKQALSVVPEQVDDSIRQSQAVLHYDYATVLTIMGFPAQGVVQAEKSLQYYVQAHDIEGQAKVYGILVLANGYCGETVRAESEGILGLQLAERINYIRMQGYIHAYLAMVKVCRGKMDEAWDHATQAQKIGGEYGYSEISALSIRTIGDIFRYLGNDVVAMDYYQQAYEIGSNTFIKYDSLSRLGYLKSITGQTVEGQKLILEALHASEELSFGSVALSSRVYLFISQKDQAALDAATPELNELMQECKSRGLLAQWGITLGLLARLDYFHDRPEQAEEKITDLLAKGKQFEGLWASLLIQILHDRSEATNNFLYEQWRVLVENFINMMESNCQSQILRESFCEFKNHIDKIIGE